MSPCSTIRPAYMTAIRSATSATTPRSWVIKISPICRSSWSSLSSFITCACTVTSKAVVGSSAISTAGSNAMAMAIMIRCRIPPENWCGKAFTRCLAAGICTRSINRTARSRESDLFIPRCLRNISAICQPTGNTGFNED